MSYAPNKNVVYGPTNRPTSAKQYTPTSSKGGIINIVNKNVGTDSNMLALIHPHFHQMSLKIIWSKIRLHIFVSTRPHPTPLTSTVSFSHYVFYPFKTKFQCLSNKCLIWICLNPFPKKTLFLHACSTSLLKKGKRKRRNCS